ncbi:TPA: thiolase domain-containing protein [Candidatus Woesearchaeota archaeon]|nr:MAG: Acetyl-CoA acetyltransferase [archaeon GW2011_AR11]HIJ18216.1 thiolase domain-containing protein [Candidatus Woesearchaeota archaeon]
MMYVKGVGMTKFGVHVKSSQELCYDAAMEAMDDAGISPDRIDAVVVSRGDCATDGERQRLFPSVISSILGREGIPMVQVMAACAGGGAAMWDAVHSGHDTVLVLGVEKLTPGTTAVVTDDLMMAAESVYEQREGLNFPAQNALIAQQYMRRYGVSMGDLSLVALKNHENANLNPKARFYGKKVTLDMIKKSPIICSPLRLFDCSASVDGAAAVIITKEKTDVGIIGSALCADRLPAFESPDMTTWASTRIAAGEAYRQAGISPEDLDCVELHDAFTPVELMSYEDLGLCGKGEAKKLIRKGRTKLNGDIPVNSSGGLKAKGHPVSATGVSQIYEMTKQLRGQAEKRQVDGARIGIAHNVGGAGSTATVHVLRKGG